MAKSPFLSKLALGATLLALCVIALGAFTRLVDAGLGCPDWPGCYGKMIPNSIESPSTFVAYKAWAEMIHRYFVGGLSLFILFIMSVVVQKSLRKHSRNRINIFLTIGLLLVLCYQILLGQWTVTLKLLPAIVTLHLLGGFFILSLLWLLYLNNRLQNVLGPVVNYPQTQHPAACPRDPGALLDPADKPRDVEFWGPNHSYLLFFAVIGLFLLLTQITLGAWTSTNYAALSCSDFPFCDFKTPMEWQFKSAFQVMPLLGINYEGGVLSESARQTIQMTHRIGALVLTGYLIFFLIGVFNKLPNRYELTKPLFFLIAILSLQICMGIMNVMFKLPLHIALTHNLLAALLLLSLLTFIFNIYQVKKI